MNLPVKMFCPYKSDHIYIIPKYKVIITHTDYETKTLVCRQLQTGNFYHKKNSAIKNETIKLAYLVGLDDSINICYTEGILIGHHTQKQSIAINIPDLYQDQIDHNTSFLDLYNNLPEYYYDTYSFKSKSYKADHTPDIYDIISKIVF